MTRVKYRRAQREKEKAKTATYNLTKAQLEIMIKQGVRERVQEIRQEATDSAVNTALILMFTLPMEVLMDYYWPKSYAKRIPEFATHVLDYYERWQNGELDMDELRHDLWEYGGIRIEEGDVNNGEAAGR